MSALELFTFGDQQIRTLTIDGEPWFVVADVARLLGYRDAANAARLLRPQHEGYSEMSTPSGVQNMRITNRSGFYRLILRSNAENAEAVQDWVTDEVLPAIAETGSYGQDALDPSTPAGAALVLQAALTFQAQVIEMAPKAAAYDKFLDSTSLIKIEVAARQAGVGRTSAYRLLREGHVIQRWNKSPMQTHAHRFHEVASNRENSKGEVVTDYTTKVRPEHFDWLVSTLERLSGKGEMKALA